MLTHVDLFHLSMLASLIYYFELIDWKNSSNLIMFPLLVEIWIFNDYFLLPTILKITCYISPCANILRISLMYLTSSAKYICLKNYEILLQSCPKWLLCLLCAILDRYLYILIKLAVSCIPDHHSELGRGQVTFSSSALCHPWFLPTRLVQPLKSYHAMKCIHYFCV